MLPLPHRSRIQSYHIDIQAFHSDRTFTVKGAVVSMRCLSSLVVREAPACGAVPGLDTQEYVVVLALGRQDMT
jgi:hypothetical protein